MSSCEHILSDLIHDLAQPLSNIETSAYCLGHIVDSNPRAQEHLKMIQQQLDTASAMLSAAAAELRRRNAERVAGAPAFELAATASR
jgi:signal transduction histidine kinase